MAHRNTKMRATILGLAILICSMFGFSQVQALTLTPVRLEISGNPGETLNKEMTLINERQTAETYYVSYANFEARGDSGTPTFIEAKDGLGTWISTEQSVFIAPGTSKIIPIKITIPRNAEPGGYFGAIFWGTEPKTNNPGEVAIGAKTGMLVLLSVKGDVKVSGGILSYDTKDAKHFYESLPISFSYSFKNDGGDRIKPEGNIVIRNMLGLKSKVVPANTVEGNILPTQIRHFETAWMASGKDAVTKKSDIHGFFNNALYEWHNFALGRYSATLDLAYGANGQKATAKISFWVLPWQFLILFFISLFIIIFIVRKGLKSYNNYVINQAHKRILKESGSIHDSLN